MIANPHQTNGEQRITPGSKWAGGPPDGPPGPTSKIHGSGEPCHVRRPRRSTCPQALLCFVVIGSVVALISCSGKKAPKKMTPEPQKLREVTLTTKDKRLSVEFAVTPEEQAKGVMFRDAMPADHGMLFAYRKPEKRSFFMLNCRFPLDIAFIDRDGTITQIEQMEPREAMPTRSKSEVPFVLEMNKGWFERNGVKVGDKIEMGL